MFDGFKRDFKYRMKRLNFKYGSLERRLSVVFLLTGALLSFIGFFTTILVGDPFWFNIPNLFVGMMCLLIPIFFDDLIKPTTVALYIVAVLFFPYLFFTMGGIRGSGFIYFILITIYFAFFLKGKKLLITNTFLLVFYTSVIVFSFQNPHFGFNHHDPTTHLLNIIIGVVSVSLVISIIAQSTFNEYSKERDTIKELMKELEIRNKALTDLSIKDQLTGVYNRRHFLKVLDNEIAHYKVYKQDFHVMMIDLDDFKQINDTHGHLFGDEVLRKVAKQISKSLRDYDIIARYGGEEFCVIISHLNPEDSFTIAERIRLQVENLVLRHEARTTVTIGVTSYCDEDSAESIINRADKNMYEAKSQGKNIVYNKEC